MSLSKVDELYFWWMISFSTVKLCSLSASVSLMAVFPRYTDIYLVLVTSLHNTQAQMVNRHPHTQVCKHVTYPYESYCHCSMRIAVEEIIVYYVFCVCVLYSHPSTKQCAAVTTQQGEMREPPQRNPWRLWKRAATHGCDSIGVKEPPTILCILRSDLSPHVSSVDTHRTGVWVLIMGIRRCHIWDVFKQHNYLYRQLVEVLLLV